jgi:hypothetical protein
MDVCVTLLFITGLPIAGLLISDSVFPCAVIADSFIAGLVIAHVFIDTVPVILSGFSREGLMYLVFWRAES